MLRVAQLVRVADLTDKTRCVLIKVEVKAALSKGNLDLICKLIETVSVKSMESSLSDTIKR